MPTARSPIGDVWSFTATPVAAWAPSPVTARLMLPPTPCSDGRAGINATTHDVYFSTDRAAVESGASSAQKADKQTTTSYTAAGLERGQDLFLAGR